jgi:primosomal protein N' (replication factor Y)
VITLPPQPASMARRGGRHRAQLLLIAAQRPALRAAIEPWVMRLASLKAARQVRWSIDVDPIDVF